jgi:hypothetical protein
MNEKKPRKKYGRLDPEKREQYRRDLLAMLEKGGMTTKQIMETFGLSDKGFRSVISVLAMDRKIVNDIQYIKSCSVSTWKLPREAQANGRIYRIDDADRYAINQEIMRSQGQGKAIHGIQSAMNTVYLG